MELDSFIDLLLTECFRQNKLDSTQHICKTIWHVIDDYYFGLSLLDDMHHCVWANEPQTSGNK